MGAYLDSTSFGPALKELYDGQELVSLVYKNNPTLALIKKKTDFQGKYKPLPIIYGTPQGASANFSQAQANQSGVAVTEFLLTRAFDYAIGTMSGEMAYAAKTDMGAFLPSLKALSDNTYRTSANRLAAGMFRTPTGSVAQISTITAGVIVLQDPTSVVQFQINMVVQATATDGSAPLAAYGYVIGVNNSLGQVTVSATSNGAAGTPTSWVATNFLLQAGDSNAKMAGFAAWCPLTTPSATPFFGVNRSIDARLYGTIYSATAGQSIEESLIDCSVQLALNGSTPDYTAINYTSYGNLLKSLGSKIQYVDLEGPQGISFRALELNTPVGPVKIVPDRNCPGYTAYMLQLDTWELDSAGECPQILEDIDGNILLRVYNADAYELRVGAYHNLGCKAPFWNAGLSLAA